MKFLAVKREPLDRFFHESPTIRWSLLFFVLLIFSISLDPSLIVNLRRYQIGDVARTDVKATQDFFIEDEAATENRRREAVRRVVTVYDFNPKVRKESVQRLTAAFDDLRTLYHTEKQAFETDSNASARFLPSPEGADRTRPAHSGSSEHESIEKAMQAHKNQFERKSGVDISNEAFFILIEEAFSEQIPTTVATIVNKILSVGVVANKEILLQEETKGITLRNVETQTEAHVNNLSRFYGPEQARTMVRVIGDPVLRGMDYAYLNLIVDIAQQLLRPNITLNSHETEARRVSAANGIKPVLSRIKKGEMLIREGERVTPLQLRKVKAMDDQTRARRFPLAGAGAAAVLTTFLVIHYRVRLKNRLAANRHANKDLLFLTCALTAFIVLVKIAQTLPDNWFFGLAYLRQTASTGFGIPLSAGAMIVCLFLGREVALIFSLALALCATMLLGTGLETFVYHILGCTMASWWLKDCRERKIIIKTGLKVGLLNVFLSVTINGYIGNWSWNGLAVDATLAFFGGIVAGVIAAGTAPVVEMLFGYTTTITLLELANLDQPILRRLMLEAPGTYHHSVVVGSLVEAAAASIKANPILAKVCGYYHDIGKLKQPTYFIENQTNRRNRHDRLAPSLSALILIAHVKNGVEIARENKLGQAILDTIQQHHGTSLISYFYEKAKKAKADKMVNIDDFRYPGPRPQTREAALVMLADVVEAASRTLANPTPSRIQGLVQDLINKVFSDGQLDHCDLTLRDLHQIAKSFNKILNGIHHHRIEYLDSTAIVSGKVKNANSDRKSATSPSPIDSDAESQRQTRIRRLGLS